MERLKWRVESGEVALGLFEGRVCHAVREIAVVRQENQSRSILVEASDGFEVGEL